MIERQENRKFDLVSKYQPTGDQPNAIKELTAGIDAGKRAQVLLGATGTGKTFTISNVIKNVNKPTLILSHNKTLVGQLYGEFKEFFPNNAVEYFVSYYDYYQPEAYVPQVIPTSKRTLPLMMRLINCDTQRLVRCLSVTM